MNVGGMARQTCPPPPTGDEWRSGTPLVARSSALRSHADPRSVDGIRASAMARSTSARVWFAVRRRSMLDQPAHRRVVFDNEDGGDRWAGGVLRDRDEERPSHAHAAHPRLSAPAPPASVALSCQLVPPE